MSLGVFSGNFESGGSRNSFSAHTQNGGSVSEYMLYMNMSCPATISTTKTAEVIADNSKAIVEVLTEKVRPEYDYEYVPAFS